MNVCVCVCVCVCVWCVCGVCVCVWCVCGVCVCVWCVCVCTFVCMMLQMCLYNLLCFRLSYSMQLSEHRIFTAIDFHHLSVQQHTGRTTREVPQNCS